MVLYEGSQALLVGVADEGFNGAVNALELGGETVGDMDVEVDGEDDGPLPALLAPAPRAQTPRSNPASRCRT